MKTIKKMLALILVLSVLSAMPVGAVSEKGSGDADASGSIDMKDVRLYLKSVVSGVASDAVSDLNDDGVIDTLDVRVLLDCVMAADKQTASLLAFWTMANPSRTHDEIEANRVAQIIGTYEEFEAVCAKIRPNFYTLYEGEDGSFDAWAQTITPVYFETKSLFVITYGTDARCFEATYEVTETTVDITVMKSNRNGVGAVECWQWVMELDKGDLNGRELTFQTAYKIE
ncbi:MAG: hypothetical protein IJB27_00295 [Clostridia bacterium]|nr:hypothetical protein [Clostridia bacterium]